MTKINLNTSDRLIFVNIKKSYEAMSTSDTASPYYRETLKECTEKYWRVSDDKASKATHVLGCYRGIVMCVIKIEQVRIATQAGLEGRKIFKGIEIQQSDYIGLDIRKIFNTLANFNTRYYNL